MANFRNTVDLLDSVLRRSGELTTSQGTSPLASAALTYLDQLHRTIICGGNELETDIDESWIWAQSRRPLILNLNPPITTGTVTLTQGSQNGTFSSAPQIFAGTNASVEGWFLKPDNGPELYKITSHASGATTFALDGAFPQANYASTFHLFQLEYDLVTSYITIDKYNDTLDFASRGAVAQSATVTHGTYDPATLATTVATALQSADTNLNTYAGSYDTLQRTFSFTSSLNGTATAIFSLVGNGTNFYRSGWDTLGFDFLTQSGSASYVSGYPLSATARLSRPARCYYGFQFGYGSESGQIMNLDPVRMDLEYPLIDVRQGTPQFFCVVSEHTSGSTNGDGRMRVRFNKYPATPMRVEFEHIPYPKDLQNNAQSIPRIPRKYINVLDYGAGYLLCADKVSDRAQGLLGLAQGKLKGMMKANRTELQKTSQNFGAVIARPDLMPSKRYRRLNTYGYDSNDS